MEQIYNLRDDLGQIIESGSIEFITDLKRVLLADPSNVTEEDEIIFEEYLRNVSWYGNLTINEQVL